MVRKIKHLVVSLNWTLVSLSIYFTLPVAWWAVIQRNLPVRSYYFIEFGISILIWGIAFIFYLRSYTNWQRALCLQLGLMLAPASIQLISYIFWTTVRQWVVASHFSEQTINSTFLFSGLIWIGLMFTPALIPFLMGRIDIKNVLLVVRNVFFQFRDGTSTWLTLLLWITATITGVIFTILLESLHAFWWTSFLPLGILQSLVLRRYWKKTGDWFVVTVLGLACGGFLSTRYLLLDLYVSYGFPVVQLDPVFIWSTFGTVLGLSQWLVLRRHMPNAYWWIIANMVMGLVGAYSSSGGVIGILVTSLLFGIVTGFLLILLSLGVEHRHGSANAMGQGSEMK